MSNYERGLRLRDIIDRANGVMSAAGMLAMDIVDRIQTLIAERDELRKQTESMRGAIERLQMERDEERAAHDSAVRTMREVERQRDIVTGDLVEMILQRDELQKKIELMREAEMRAAQRAKDGAA